MNGPRSRALAASSSAAVAFLYAPENSIVTMPIAAPMKALVERQDPTVWPWLIVCAGLPASRSLLRFAIGVQFHEGAGLIYVSVGVRRRS
jgi:hypothetical protein